VVIKPSLDAIGCSLCRAIITLRAEFYAGLEKEMTEFQDTIG